MELMRQIDVLVSSCFSSWARQARRAKVYYFVLRKAGESDFGSSMNTGFGGELPVCIKYGKTYSSSLMIINVQPEARTSLKSQITKRVPQLEANQPVPDGTVRSSRCRPGPFWRLLLSAPSFSCKKRRALVSSLLFAPSFRTATSSSSFAIASPLTCTLYFAMVLVNRTLASGHLAITDLDIPVRLAVPPESVYARSSSF